MILLSYRWVIYVYSFFFSSSSHKLVSSRRGAKAFYEARCTNDEMFSLSQL